MNESLQTTLKTLRLSGLIQSLDVRLQEAAGNSLTHAESCRMSCSYAKSVRYKDVSKPLFSGN